MAPRQRFVRGRGLCGLAVLALFLPAALPAGAPKPEETLPLGETRERPIAAGEAHAWQITVPPGTSLLVTVEQHSIALVLETQGAQGGAPIAVHEGDRWGPEVLLLETAGEYRLAVRPLEESAWPGRYTIQTETLPASAKRDALALMSQAGREALPATPEARRQALGTYRKALVAWRALGERAWEAQTLACLAMLDDASGDLRSEAADFEAALTLWKELGEHHREAEALLWLSVLYPDTKGIEKAREALETSISLWHGLEERYDEAEARGGLCFLEFRRGSLAASLACYEENRTFFHGLGDLKQEALILNNIGGAYDALGEPDKALDSYQSALALRHALGDRIGEVGSLNNIALIHRTLGEWQEALRLYAEARKILTPVGDHALEATLLNGIGVIYNSVGEPQQALDYFTDALKLRRQVGKRSGEIITLNNLGTAWRKLGNLEKALSQHRQALLLATSFDATSEAVSRKYLAEVYLNRGDPSAALHEIEAARLALRGQDDRRDEMEVLHLQGRVLALAGRAREALPVLRDALVRRRDLRDRVGEAETLYELALAERSLGQADDARVHAKAAVDRVEELRIGFLGANLRTSFLATRRRAFSLLMDLLMDQHAADPAKGYDREAFLISERARARGLLDVLRAGRAGNAAPPELLARRSSLLRRLSAKVDQRWNQSGARAEALDKEIDVIRLEVDDVEVEIRRHDARFAAFSAPQPVHSEEISSWLEPGTMLVEYSLGEDRSFLWTVEAGQIHSFVLPRQKEIEDQARRVYKELSTVESGSARRGQAAETLSQILLGPIWSDSNAARLHRLVVVPDGALGILPFAALPVPDPGKSWQAPGRHQPLLEHLEVVSIPSATTLAVQRQRLERRAPAAKWAAIFADPVFAADDPRLTHRLAANLAVPGKKPGTESPLRGEGAGGLPSVPERLPSTEKEAKAIAALAPSGQVRIGLGPAANREAVLSGDLRDYRVLHFATHAVANTQNPELSGLVLSLVDAEGRPREGFLGLSDIYELDLDADLVVLSGCQTALGKEVRGEGLLGLTRGFQYAGVPRVVASLWRVQDRATAELMTRFYRAMWGDHLPPAAALRKAQRSLRHQPRYRDPYSWAGFVLQGDWH